MNNEYLTVTQINKYIKYKFENDSNLNLVYLKGEISNFKNHSSGHLYFTLKDENSRIMAVMFRNNAMKIKFNPTDGTKVLVIGRINVYEANGNYQIYVEEMMEDGIGNLALEFEKLKKKLSEKGYFDERFKKPIPKFPKKIGIITATTGAAIRDIITTINRRYRNVELDIFPCLVQGVGAKEDIVRNLNLANNFDLDVIILGRGGGVPVFQEVPAGRRCDVRRDTSVAAGGESPAEKPRRQGPPLLDRPGFFTAPGIGA